MRYCIGCHNARTKSGNLSLADVVDDEIADHAETWERVLRKVGAGMMPPAGMPRPDEGTLVAFLTTVAADLDRGFDRHPAPGRTATFHRLNRNGLRDPERRG
jgi:hypothetical protein